MVKGKAERPGADSSSIKTIVDGHDCSSQLDQECDGRHAVIKLIV